MRKRITSLLLTLAMLLSLLPAMGVTASAAEPKWTTVNSYEELQTAVKDKKEYIKLGRDIDTTNFHSTGSGLEVEDWLTFENQTCTLDLNGKTLTLMTRLLPMGVFLRVYDGSNLTIKDSSPAKTGAITGAFKNYISSDAGCCLFHVHRGSSLTLENGSFTVTSAPHEDHADTVRAMDSNITIKEGVTISHPGKFYPEHSYIDLDGNSYALRTDGKCKVIIDGGVFDGHVKLSGYQDTNGAIQISGGTFKKDVQVLYTAEENNSNPAVTVNGGTFEGTVYLQRWSWKESLYMPYRLNGGTFKGTVDLCADDDIYEKDKPTGNPNIALGLNECFGYSAVVTPTGTFAGPNAHTAVILEKLDHFGKKCYKMLLQGTASDPVRIIPNAWGMESVTLDGTKINYAKDWKGAVEEMDNSTAHTIKFTWKPLASELVNAGYSYRAECDRYISGNKTPTTDTISATDTERSYTIEKGAAPKVYSFALHLNLKKDDSPYNVGIYSNEHIVKLVVNEAPPAPPEPPAPVAHSIKITNSRGTANTTSAFAGDTVTVTAKDDTANNMMFTQWYTYTAGVTFADATQKKTTFVMPDCDVEVNPGFQQVSFRNQPLDSWLSSVDDSKVYFAFSQPITSWKLVNENDQTLDSGDAADANALVEATLVPKPKDTVMTCRIIVTSNGQNFTSRTFKLKWYDVPGAPDVTVYPAGGKFVETLEVNLETPNTYWEILYTTNGSDPYDKSGETWTKNPAAIVLDDSTQVPINKDTTIKACLYNSEGHSNMERFGDIVTCDFTKVELTPPVADPVSGTSFYDRLNVSLSTDIVNAQIMWSGEDLDVDALGRPGMWKEYEPEKESITLSGSYGMHGFYALTAIHMEHPDGYTYWVHSDKQDYSYPRITYADMANASVTGKVNEEITPVDVSITLHGDVFAEDLTAGTDVSGWFTNLPNGLKATVKEKTNYTATLVVTISGTPTETSAAAISVKMPKSALRYTGTGTAVEQTVLSNPKAYYSIGTAAAHTHDTGKQSWASLNDYEHYRSCTAGDETKFAPHSITSWTDKGDGTHTGTCTDCSYVKTESHNWQWVVDTHATSTTAGKKHEECPDCHAKRNEGTVIPATGGGSSSGGGGSSGGAGVTTYAITVQNSKNGGVTASHKSAAKDTAVTLTVTPDKGYVLDTLNVLDSKDKAVKLTQKNGKYTFTMPSSKVTVSAAFKAAAPASENPFTDVPSGAYYEDAVIWAVKKDITSGTSATTFNPDGSCTRAQAVTFLWRAAGSPEPKSAAMPFTDVPAGSYFEKAVLWAVENGITKGTSDTTFSPDASCTRAQIVTFLWRAGGSPAVSGNSAFSDVAADAYYAAAVAWAEKNGVTGGIGGGLFGSDNTCTRAQIVTFLHRAMK